MKLNQLNKELHKMGMPKDICLVRGKGYFYFYGGGTVNWYTSSVLAFSLEQLTVKEWYDEYVSLSKGK